MGLQRRTHTALGAGLSAALLAIAAGVPAQAATIPGWRIVFSRHFGGPANFSAYWAVAAISQRDAWALGGGTSSAVAAHWNGRKWLSSPLPAGLNSAINAVSAPAAKDVWAVSDQGGYILHFNGTRWAVASKRFSGFGELTGVTAFSPANVWVFGGPGAAPGFGTWHYNGHSWKQETAAIGIVSASALSPSNMWAIGSSTSPEDSIVHFTGTWRREKSAALSGLQFHGILALTKKDVWATANIQTNGFRPYLVHLADGKWVRTKIPWPVSPTFDLASDGRGGLWLTAVSATTGYWEIHRSASGRWSRTRIASAAVFDVTLIPGTASLWGAGDVLSKTSASAAIFAYGRVG